MQLLPLDVPAHIPTLAHVTSDEVMDETALGLEVSELEQVLSNLLAKSKQLALVLVNVSSAVALARAEPRSAERT